MPVTIGAKLDSDFTDPIGLLGDCHRRIERFLGALVALAEQSDGGALDEESRSAFDTALRYFREAAPRHVADEEESLFPRLHASADPDANAALVRLERDHKSIQAWHAELHELGARLLAGGGLEQRELARFRELVEQLENAYAPHIALEDDEIFPSARRLLSADQLRAVGREMAVRRGARAV